MDMSFDKLKDKVKQVVSERLRHGWRADGTDYFTWAGVFEVLPEVISRALEEKGFIPLGRDEGREHRTLNACNDKLTEIETEAHKIINNWDLRAAGKLIELFPEALPKKYQKAKFDIDMNDSGQWRLYFKEPMKMRM